MTRADSALPPEVGPPAALDLRATLAGRRLLVVGATGFLGKVWLALILASFPEVEHLYLLVRPKENLDAPSRLREKVLTSDVFGPLRERHGEGFDRFVESKLTALEGDITAPSLGLSPELRETLRGRIDAVVNVAGIVDFDPPLDEALGVNALGCRELVRVARELGGARILHTSTCFTAGARTGVIEERDPREVPFPRAGKLDTADWDAEREIDECLEDIARVRAATHAELSRPRRRSAERELAELGMERAERWGWPNTYTYTKSLGEQIIAGSGLPNCIVRPAIVESTAVLPFPGWNEGINTSAPIIFLIREGGLQVPGSRNNLDLIPCDMVCAALLLALGELLEGTHRPVYQAAASDLNPCSMERFFELSGLHKRRYYRRTGRGGALLSAVQRRYEGALLDRKQYEAYGPRRVAQAVSEVSGLVRRLAVGPLAEPATAAARSLDDFARRQLRLARVMDTFLPFIAEYQYVFRADNVRAAYARLPEAQRALVPWYPERLDWRQWFLEVHVPALERYVFPLMERRSGRRA